jgi:hypothetical protein
MNLLKELEGNGWKIQTAIQTTFPFDPQFYSRYVTSRLNRRNCSQPLVLVDSTKYESNISDEWSSAPIGDAYLAEPVYSPQVFHPKINLYASSQSVFFTVSSANLTLSEYCDAIQIGQSGGLQEDWLDNDDRETDEIAAVAQEVTDFIEQLGNTDWITGTDAQNYIDESVELLDWLEPPSLSDRSAIFLSNLDTPLLEQILDHIGSIEGAQLFAPFWGSPGVMKEIIDQIEPEQIEFIVEDGNTNLDVTALDTPISRDFEIRTLDHTGVRWLHAKVLTLRGEWGSACLYGSANMTGAALLSDAGNGNVEAGIFRIEDEPRYFDMQTGDVLTDDAFEYSVSGPVDPESITRRERDYEGWETERHQPEIQLLDARLSAANEQGDSTLHLTVEGVDGDTEVVELISVSDQLSKEVSIEGGESTATVEVEIREEDRPSWANATVQLRGLEDDRESNVRRVSLETQEYYTEFRQMADSNGRAGSDDLINAVLFNNETIAANVLHEAYSMLEEQANTTVQQSSQESQRQDTDDDEDRTWQQRRFRTVSSASSRRVSTPKLVEQILDYHLVAAASALDTDEPGVDDLNTFVDHMDSFWELMEACLVCDLIGATSDSKVLDRCKNVLHELRTDRVLREFRQSVNRTVNKIESDSTEVNVDDIADLPVWKELYRVFFVHPVILMEIEDRLGTHLLDPRWLLQEVHEAFTELTPYAQQYVIETETTAGEAERIFDSITSRLSERKEHVESISHDPLAVATFFILMREGSEFITTIASSPRLSDNQKQSLGEWTQQGRSQLDNYGLKQTKLLLATPAMRDVETAFRELEQFSNSS